MTTKAFRWCPFGCGKRVTCIYKEKDYKIGKIKGIYECSVCKKRFEKQDLE